MMQLCTRKQLACNNATNKGRKQDGVMLNTFGTQASLKTLDFCAFLDVVITLHVAGVHQDLYIYILMSSLHVYRHTKRGKSHQKHVLKIPLNVAFEFLNFGIFHQFLSY